MLFILAVLILLILLKGNLSTSSPIGPVNISRREGEKNVVIMCPTFQAVAPIWRINNHIYGASSLPSPFYPAYDNLLILTVLSTMDNFTFQCFIPTGVRHEVVPSSTGTLSVDSVNLLQHAYAGTMSTGTQSDNAEVTLDHWRLHFDFQKITLPWKYYFGNDSTVHCSFSEATFHIKGWHCIDGVRSTLVWQRNLSNTTAISITSSNVNTSIFINMTVASNSNPNVICTSLSYQFQIGNEGK